MCKQLWGDQFKKANNKFTCAQKLQRLTTMPIVHYNNDLLLFAIRQNAILSKQTG